MGSNSTCEVEYKDGLESNDIITIVVLTVFGVGVICFLIYECWCDKC